MNQLINFFVKNYKTTVPGLAIAIVGYLVSTHKISTDAGAMIGGVLTALGFSGAKDADKTGTGN